MILKENVKYVLALYTTITGTTIITPNFPMPKSTATLKSAGSSMALKIGPTLE